ncbi:MAG: lipid-A-disaccharide synthase [Gemmatimonadota bacterium]
MTGAPGILILAGEASGDAHAAAVARALKKRFPGARLTGMGGPALAGEGVELLATLDDLAVMGFGAVFSRLGAFHRLRRRLRARLASGSVDLVIPVDYAGFNMRVLRDAHGLGIPVLWYIAPKVWAWRRYRARALARRVRSVAVVLPFEEAFLARYGADARFVGHPLLDRPDPPDREAFCRVWKLDPGRPVLALFPGSRSQEVKAHLEPFLGAAALLRADRPDLQVVMARAPGVAPAMLERAACAVSAPGFVLTSAAAAGSAPVGQVRCVDDGPALLAHARAALLKAGTSTLEAALAGTPAVVAYRTDGLTWALARLLVRVDHVALPNLLAGERIMPELLQDRVEPVELARHVRPLLDPESPQRHRQLRALGRVSDSLGDPGAADRVAAMAVEILAAERGDAGYGAGRGSVRDGLEQTEGGATDEGVEEVR